ncbi:putative quinol monooxygenase [Marinobacterium jannaschii]|uniref:putative quinol monooxygenase n=1 Tax=Marinobacterium jannaschii TaxID=64970 RepID=UPI000484289D|nr:putative quinol monooxygenase [Marinobacterium jannaschii]
MHEHLFIIARISPKPEFMNDAREALLSIVPPTLNEEGCRQFSVHQDETSLYLYEEWENQDALDRHYAMPYIAPVFESYKEWLAKPVEISKLTKLA